MAESYVSVFTGRQIDDSIGLINGKGLDNVNGVVKRDSNGSFSAAAAIDIGAVPSSMVETTASDSDEKIATSKAMRAYVDANGGKIDSVYASVQEIPITNKTIDLVPWVAQCGDGEGYFFIKGDEGDYWENLPELYIYPPNSYNRENLMAFRFMGGSNDEPVDVGIYKKEYIDTQLTNIQTSLDNKQSTLVSGTNIKTINNQSLLGSGNIDIQGGGSSNIFIAEPNVTSYAELEAAINAQKLICIIRNNNMAPCWSQISSAQNYIFLAIMLTDSDVRSYSIDNNDTWTSQDTELQKKLVSGTNIKTINNQSILGSGNITIAGGLQNLVDGSATGSVRGIGTTAESSTYTLGAYAFAEGETTKASGSHSHAEGAGTIASGDRSHAEGLDTTARGTESHAEGILSEAAGAYSHAQNNYTIAAKPNQTTIGKYNIVDTETNVDKQKALIIGNGTSDSERSNALTVDWGGEVELYLGDVKEGTSTTGSGLGEEEKIVTTTNSDFVLKSGAYVLVTFTNKTGGLEDISLNVDNTGIKAAYYQGSPLNSSNGEWQAGDTVAFRYDGTYYQRVDNDDNIVLYRSGIATNGMVKVKQKLAQLTRQISDLQLDYVVDTGSSVPSINEHYTWTKWNSGKMEMDVYYAGNLTSYSSGAITGTYAYYHDLAFPVSFIDDTYSVVHSFQVSSGLGMASGILSNTTTGVRLFGYGSQGGTQACKIRAHIVGRWK